MTNLAYFSMEYRIENARARSAFHLSAEATYTSKPSNPFFVTRKNSSILTNFLLVSVSQYNANSPVIYRSNAYSPAIYRVVSQI